MRGVCPSDAIESVVFRHEEGNEGEKNGVKWGNRGFCGGKLLIKKERKLEPQRACGGKGTESAVYSRKSAGSPLLIAARTLAIRQSRSPKSAGSMGS